MIKKVDDYLDDLQKIYPRISKKDLKKVISYGLRIMAIAAGREIPIKFQGLNGRQSFLIGKMLFCDYSETSIKTYYAFIKRIRRKIRLYKSRSDYKHIWVSLDYEGQILKHEPLDIGDQRSYKINEDLMKATNKKKGFLIRILKQEGSKILDYEVLEKRTKIPKRAYYDALLKKYSVYVATKG